MQIVKILIFVISIIGYYAYIKRKSNIKEEFIPIILISSISLVIYLAGILNFMRITAIIIPAIGIILFIKSFYLIIKNKEKISLNKNIIILFVFLIWAVWILKGILLTHYDNFSHWGIIIKEMIVKNKLPNFETVTITFTSYPPGTACWAYFVCKYLGRSEWIMLLSQSMLIISSLYAMTAFCNKKNKINYLILVSAIIYSLITNIFINQLLVDTVLSVMGIAALSIIFYYRKESENGLKYSIPILSLLVLVKNSGIFFVVINLILWIIFFVDNNKLKQLFKMKMSLLLLLPIAVFLIWNAHTDLVFKSASVSKHSMSVENYAENLGDKNYFELKEIATQMKDKMLTIKDKENIILLSMLLVYIILIIISFKNEENRNDIITMFVFFILSYIIYQISLYAMYILSMPVIEAVKLAAYARYFKTLVVFNYGITVITVLNFLNNYEISSKTKKYTYRIVLTILMMIPIILYYKSLDLLYVKSRVYGTELRNLILDYKNTYNIEENRNYLIYVSNDYEYPIDYLYYICKYEFRSKNVTIIKSFSELKEIDYVFDFKYLIVLNKDDETEEFFNMIKGDINTNVIRF